MPRRTQTSCHFERSEESAQTAPQDPSPRQRTTTAPAETAGLHSRAVSARWVRRVRASRTHCIRPTTPITPTTIRGCEHPRFLSARHDNGLAALPKLHPQGFGNLSGWRCCNTTGQESSGRVTMVLLSRFVGRARKTTLPSCVRIFLFGRQWLPKRGWQESPRSLAPALLRREVEKPYHRCKLFRRK